jgi:prolyl-tRNA synthetase
MKDGYSFHSNEEDMKREFNLMEQTYKKIFTKLGLDYRSVEADSGAIGGNGSKEFHILASSGEDTLVICDSCDYAANIEAAKRAKKSIQFLDKPKETIFTPNISSIEQLSTFLNIDPTATVKAVAKKGYF